MAWRWQETNFEDLLDLQAHGAPRENLAQAALPAPRALPVDPGRMASMPILLRLRLNLLRSGAELSRSNSMAFLKTNSNSRPCAASELK